MILFLATVAVIYLLAAVAWWDIGRIQRRSKGPTGGLFPLFDEHYEEQSHDVEEVS